MTTAPIVEYANPLDQALANSPGAKEGIAKAFAHDAKVDGAMQAQQIERAKISQQRGEIAVVRGTIQRDEQRAGPLRRPVNGEMVHVDRLGPLDEKDAQLQARSREIEKEKLPLKIGEPCGDWLKANRNRTLSAAVNPPKIEPSNVDHKAYDKQFAVTDSIGKKIGEIWRAPRPLAEVLPLIPDFVDRNAQPPRLGDLFRGYHVAEFSGKRTVETPYPPEILFPETRVRQDSGSNPGVVPDVMAMLFWAERDKWIEKYSDFARARAVDSKALSIAEKHAALEAAYAEFEKSVRLEVAIGFAIEEQTGGMVHFRRAHPAVFLNLAADPEAIANYGRLI